MKHLLFCCCAVMISAAAMAQSKVPEFGDISRGELEMKACDFDKDAPAMVLLDEGRFAYKWNNTSNFRMINDVRMRIKIFNTRSLDKGNVVVFYRQKSGDRDDENIKDIQAYTYNLDEKGEIVKQKLEKDAIFRDRVQDNIYSVKFSCPGVKAGSVIEYRYTRTGEILRNIPSWSFQGELPVACSRYTIETPHVFQFTKNIVTTTPPELQESTYKERVFSAGGGELPLEYEKQTYIARNISSLKPEPYMSCLNDYRQRLEFQLTAVVMGSSVKTFTSTWEELVKELNDDEDFGLQLKKTARIGALDDALATTTTPYQKMITIHNYFREHFKWDGERDYRTLKAKRVADKEAGSSGDINLLMINQLAAAGLDVKPVLVSTRDHGLVNTSYPFLHQFNQVLARVVIDGQEFFLDGTDKYNPARLIPLPVMGTNALYLLDNSTEWRLLWNEKALIKNRAVVQATISNAGVLEGKATVTSYDYAKSPRVKQYVEDKTQFTKKYLAPLPAQGAVTGLQVSNLNSDSLPLEQVFNFSIPCQASGDYLYFSPHLFTGLAENPFLANSRNTDIVFGCNQSLTLIGRIVLPEQYTYDSLPAPVTMMTPDEGIVFERSFSGSEEAIQFRITLAFTKSVYPVQEYDEVRDFYKKLYNMLNEQVVLKKK